MALQYLEALKALGASPSTKFVIPTEFTRSIEPLAGYVEKGITPSPQARPAGGLSQWPGWVDRRWGKWHAYNPAAGVQGCSPTRSGDRKEI